MNKEEPDWDALRHKRLQMLIGCWDLLKERFQDLAKNVNFSPRLAAEVVEQYIHDYKALVGSFKIEDKIQRHKIAGLMTAAIVRRKPLQLIDNQVEGASLSRHNEFFAVWHALAICAEVSDKETLTELRANPMWNVWFEDMVYHLLRNPDGESLVMIFGTLSLLHFGQNLKSD